MKRKYCELYEKNEESKDPKRMKSTKPRYSDPSEQARFEEMNVAIKASPLYNLCKWSNDMAKLLSSFAMGEWVACYSCSEMNSFGENDKKWNSYVTCISCATCLYFHFCKDCDDACSKDAQMGPYCIKCHKLLCYAHASNCGKCRGWTCQNCVKDVCVSNKCLNWYLMNLY